MNSRTTRRFRELFAALPAHIAEVRAAGLPQKYLPFGGDDVLVVVAVHVCSNERRRET